MAATTDWMWELALHYQQMRRAYPHEKLCLVFDIDGTILDMRHLIAHVLVSYDRAHGTEYFRGLVANDIDVHENRIGSFLSGRALPAAVRNEMLSWYEEHLWRPDAVLAASRPYRGSLSVIRWFQLQPDVVVALNTGRPERLRELTLRSLNEVGRAYRVSFDSDLLHMNVSEPKEGIPESKLGGIAWFRQRGLRIVAVIDNEPANLRAMAEADDTGEILFLHADTIFESQRESMPRAIAGSKYGLTAFIRENDLTDRVEFIWHGVNDEANLRQFLASDVRWAECDVRLDPLDRLVLRHDSFEETPWTRTEHPFLLEDCLEELHARGRSAALDIKQPGEALDRVVEAVEAVGFDDDELMIVGSIEVLAEDAARAVHKRFPAATVSLTLDLLGPLLIGAPSLADQILDEMMAWGVTRATLSWTAPHIREVLDGLERRGWEVNLYGIPDLESFLEASLLLPASLTADFNFPDWHYYGRGSGQRRAYHRYKLVASDNQ